MDDYRHLRITAKDIFEDMGISRSTFNRRMKEAGEPTNFKLQRKLRTGVKELDARLKDKYSSIVARCNNYRSYQYKDGFYEGMEYLPINEWIDFCLENKDKILSMWERYENNNFNMQLAISIDRIDNSKGYFKDNLQFVTHGFNSFKRNMRPVKVTHKEEDKYFMSPKEAGRSYGIREQSLSDMLSGVYREISKEFDIEESDVETVLKENNLKSLEGYYENKYL